MTDDIEIPEDEAPKGNVVEPTGNVEQAPDDGLEEVDDEDDEPADVGAEDTEGEPE